jgi:hypothetical protein
MKIPNNAENLKVELEKSGNVQKVEKIREYEGLKGWEKTVVFEVELGLEGYSFEILHSKYPTLKVQDIDKPEDKDTISVFLEVKEVTE